MFLVEAGDTAHPTHGLPRLQPALPGTCKSISLCGASGLGWLVRSCSFAFRSGYLLAAMVGSLAVAALGEGLWLVIWLVLYARRRWERSTPRCGGDRGATRVEAEDSGQRERGWQTLLCWETS